MLRAIPNRGWHKVIVAAPGPSLTEETAALCRASGLPVVAVNDAWKRLQWADVLYASDDRWWRFHEGVADFKGERWSTHGTGPNNSGNDKSETGPAYGINLVSGGDGDGFSMNPDHLHHGGNSGFAAANFAILSSAAMSDPAECVEIILTGFDMRPVSGKLHFFGNHPGGLRNPTAFTTFVRNFNRAARLLPKRIRILNATPRSALTCFPIVKPEKVLHECAGQTAAA